MFQMLEYVEERMKRQKDLQPRPDSPLLPLVSRHIFIFLFEKNFTQAMLVLVLTYNIGVT